MSRKVPAWIIPLAVGLAFAAGYFIQPAHHSVVAPPRPYPRVSPTWFIGNAMRKTKDELHEQYGPPDRVETGGDGDGERWVYSHHTTSGTEMTVVFYSGKVARVDDKRR